MKVWLEAGRPILAVAYGKTGVHLAMDGGAARPVKVEGGKINAATIAQALQEFNPGAVRLVGTRHNGTPGWDMVEPEELQSKLPGCTVECLSEAQALHLGRTSTEPEAYTILATRPDDGHIVGSARWWVEDTDSVVKLADIFVGGTNHGQLYTAPGDPLTASPYIVAGMVGEITKRHPHIRVVKVWSQDGLSTNVHFTEMVVSAGWSMANPDFVHGGGRIQVIDTAVAMLSMASKPGSKVSAVGGDSEKSE
jgi:hypothetical protein